MVDTFQTFIMPYGTYRTVYLYLPDDWQSGARRYPVIYMFDGHNLFFDETATYGTCWGLKQYLDRHPDFIVVGVDCNHEGNGRLEEYSPYPFRWSGESIRGSGKTTMRWLANELKPFIDEKYPTLPGRETTAIGGSSMGGLMSLYGVTRYNKVFSKAACLSPSVRFSLSRVKADIAARTYAPDTRIYISWGEKEARGAKGLAAYTDAALSVSRLLMARGASTYPYLQLGGTHCEASWNLQLERCMGYLFGEEYGEYET